MRNVKKHSKRSKHSKAAVSVENFSGDPLYPRIARAVEQILREGNVVAPVDVLVRMGLLGPERLEDWRFGRVPYLERVIQMNLSRGARVLGLWLDPRHYDDSLGHEGHVRVGALERQTRIWRNPKLPDGTVA